MTNAHEILEMFKDEAKAYTRQPLKKTPLMKKFGGLETVFTNCSGQPFDFDSIFEFFLVREKVVVQLDGSLGLQVHNIC